MYVLPHVERLLEKVSSVSVLRSISLFQQINRKRSDEHALAALHRLRFRCHSNLVLFILSARVRSRPSSVHLRVLPEIHEMRTSLRTPSRKSHFHLPHSRTSIGVENMPNLSSSCQRNLPQGRSLRVRSRRKHQSNLLSKPLPIGETVSRSQDALLRCRTLSLLRADQERLARVPFSRLLLQGEALPGEVQSVVHHGLARVSTPWLRTVSH